ncbi:MAG: NTP transferase domain-containing protein, partial [Hungatella sp.]
MNRYALICRSILENPQVTQRELAHILEVSLGSINTLVKECITTQLIAQEEDGQYLLLEQGQELLKQYRVDGALIIAAGFGSRFVPLTFEMPKGLLEVFGERMIERQIKQLHEVGIYDITIVVGYLKEKFEYLIDKYEVKLLYNPEYSNKNTLTTIYHARDLLRGR